MFSVTVNVYTANGQRCNLITVSPQNGDSLFVVNIGLLLQWHFCGLDALPVATPKEFFFNSTGMQGTSACSTQCDNTDSVDFESICNDSESPLFDIDDKPVEQGDEHTRLITGGPTASMMTIENPEALAEIVCLAPGEGQKPLQIMTDTNFEAMSNPEKFPYGTGCFSNEKPCKLSYQKYFNQRLLNVDGRFASDTDYLFTAQYIVEAKKILDDCNHFIFRQKPGNVTASQARDESFVSQCLRKDKAYRFLKNVRGSSAYYQRTYHDMSAKTRQLGTPTWFFTLSAADMKWPDVIQTIARQYGVSYTDEQVTVLSFEEKSKWIRSNPITAARHFQYRLNTFLNEFIKSPCNPLGDVQDFVVRIEFQARGSPHAHCMIWVKGAPKLDSSSNQDVCDFVDQYISASIPEQDSKLKDLVLQLQQHKHSSYCRTNKKCRFNYPQPPSNYTLIAEESDGDMSKYSEILCKLRKALVEEDCDDLSLDDLLDKVGVSYDEYEEALKVTTSSSVVVLKRKPNECNINYYNPHVLLAWQANMDIQYVMNAYACIMYVASYIMKSDRAMGELLKRVAVEARTEELKTQMKKVGSAFLTHREVSAQEAAYRILPLPMKRFTRTVVFVDNNLKKDRIGVLKPSHVIEGLDDEDSNVFCTNLIDRYQHRPIVLRNLCLAEFAANYQTDYKCEDGDSGESDVLPSVNIETENVSNKITLILMGMVKCTSVDGKPLSDSGNTTRRKSLIIGLELN